MYRTLLVDDRDIFILELKRLKIWGEASGFQVAGRASNGMEALQMLRTNHYDLTITDIRMPKFDGIRLLQTIKKEKLCPCVVLVSEYSEFEYARRGLVLGAFDYLVKPVETCNLVPLLTRVAGLLGMPEAAELPAFYPIAEEKSILALIGDADARIPALFESAANGVLQLLGDDLACAASINRRLYLNIVSAFFERYNWLHLYAARRSFVEGETVETPAVFRESLEHLVKIVQNLLPGKAQGVLHNICQFIAENPESPVNLSAISDNFYINPTYLSNTFRQKTGMRFNDYVTSVRMARARYLLEHSDKKAYEIGNCLGYSDTDYFNKLFKKHYGQTPSEYRHAVNHA